MCPKLLAGDPPWKQGTSEFGPIDSRGGLPLPPMTSSAAADKARLRREIRQARKAIPAAQRHHAEKAISYHARRFFRHGRRIGAYVATGSELGLDALMARALAHGGRCENLGFGLVFRRGSRNGRGRGSDGVVSIRSIRGLDLDPLCHFL